MGNMHEESLWTLKITNWPLLSTSLRITLLTVFCKLCMFVLTYFFAVTTQGQHRCNSLMLILFHFPASLPITVILNKEREGKRDADSKDEKS